MKKTFLLLLVLTLVLTAGCAATWTSTATVSPAAGTQAPATPSESTLTGTPPPSASVSPQIAVQKIDADGVKKMMDSGADVIIVDVRTPGEYSGGHLKGAINIPVETIGNTKPAQLPDTGATIVIYCRTGNRTVAAGKALTALGYTKVYDMGGIVDWPYETVTETASPAAASPSAASPKPAAGGILSTFNATDLAGHLVTADVWKGYKLTLVNIWATFCGPCIQEMPELGELSAAYKDKGVQIVGIVADSSDNRGTPVPDAVDLAKEIVAKTGANYTHILASADLNKLLLNDVSAVPTTIFVDENGKQVGTAYIGSRSGDEWAKIIDGILKGM